jgi:hypothetical protein
MTMSTAGMVLEGNLKATKAHVDEINSMIGKSITQFDGVDFDAASPKTRIKLHSEFGPEQKQLSINYVSPTQKKKHWEAGYYITVSAGMVSVSKFVGSSGTVDLDFEFCAEGKWESVQSRDQPNRLIATFPKSVPWVVKPTAAEPTFWEAIWGKTGEVPGRYKNLTLEMDLARIEMGNLDYFLTTNLLFPGMHVFAADPPQIDSGLSHGLAVPRDIILTGQIIDKAKQNSYLTRQHDLPN